MRKLFAIVFLTIALGSELRAQGPHAALIPTPLWPQNGDTSQLPKGRFVYYDPPAGEFVVYYAHDSTDGQYVQPTVLRFGTHSLVNPDVTFAVAPAGNGRIRYTYTVKNGAGVRQSIGKITILDYSDSNPQSSGANWTAHIEPHTEQDLGTPVASASLIEWTSNSAAPSIAPGSATKGLTIDSASLPGFVSMVFRADSKSTEYTPDAVASLPKEVRDQLANVMTTAWDAKNTMVIGPRFPKGASPSDIAQNYSFGIHWFIFRGKLDANSPFVQKAQALFNEQLQNGDQTFLNAGSLDFTTQAKPGLETVIANALQTIFAR